MLAHHLAHFDDKSGAFVGVKAKLVALMVKQTLTEMMECHPKAIEIEGSRNEARLYFPKLREYWWPSLEGENPTFVEASIRAEIARIKEQINGQD